MKFIKIENYKCENCGNEEYSVVGYENGKPVIICEECGTIYNGEYEVIEEKN